MKKNMKNRTIMIVMAIVIALLLINTIRINKKLSDGQSQITQYQLDKQKLDTLLNSKGDTILTQNAIITSNQQSLNDLTDTIFNLRKKDEKRLETIAYYKAITKTVARDVYIPYLDSNRMKTFSDSIELQCKEVIDYMRDSTIEVPKTASISNSNMELTATVTKENLIIDSLSIPDTLQLRFVEKKNGFLKPKTIEVQFFHSNPLITTTQSNSAIYKPKKKSFFTRVLIPVVIGVGVGLIINK